MVGTWIAARTLGGLFATGGQVVLSRHWLVFSPWDLNRTRAWLVKWLGKAGVPLVGDVDKLIAATKPLVPAAIPITALALAQARSRDPCSSRPRPA